MLSCFRAFRGEIEKIYNSSWQERKDFLDRLSKMKSDITAKKESMQYTGERKLKRGFVTINNTL